MPYPDLDDSEQGNKVRPLQLQTFPLVDPSFILENPFQFPKAVPLSLVEIGAVGIVAVPTEMTTVTAELLRRKIPDQVKIALGPANEYFEYAATEKEYQYQDYIGASTLFGPGTERCYEALIDKALTMPGSQAPRTIRSEEFEPGDGPWFGAKFGPRYWAESPEYADEEFMSPLMRATAFPRDLWPRMEWTSDAADAELSVWTLNQGGRWELQEADGDSRWKASDATSHLFALVLDGSVTQTKWEAGWLTDEPVDVDACDVPRIESRRHVLAVEPRGGVRICSVPFSLAEIQRGTITVPLASAPCPM